MESKFFVQSGFDEKEIKRIKRMLECSDKTFDVVLHWFYEHDELPRIQSSITSELLPLIEEDDPDLLNDVFAAIYMIIRSLHKYKDNYEDYTKDFKQLHPELLEQDSSINRFSKLGPLSEQYMLFFETAQAQGKGAPMLKGASMSVAMKPIVENKFDYDDMDIQTYSPKIVGYTPVVLVELESSGCDGTFSFQMPGKEFDRFLKDLLALKVEISEVEKEWKK